jgi:hypothetical protein
MGAPKTIPELIARLAQVSKETKMSFHLTHVT